MDNLEEFKKLVKTHDLTYYFSDDGKAYSSGFRSYTAILNKAREIGNPAVEIWNEHVDEKMRPPYREMFRWEKDKFVK